MLTMCFSYAFTQDGIPIVRQIDSSDEKYKPWEYEPGKAFISNALLKLRRLFFKRLNKKVLFWKSDIVSGLTQLD
jgi:hypothetical protein